MHRIAVGALVEHPTDVGAIQRNTSLFNRYEAMIFSEKLKSIKVMQGLILHLGLTGLMVDSGHRIKSGVTIAMVACNHSRSNRTYVDMKV